MVEQEEPRHSKAELVERIGGAWAALRAEIGTMTEAQLTTPGPEAWSVKDHLAHLAIWRRSLLALLRGESRAAGVGVDEQTQARGDEDELNAIFYERSKDRSLADVQAELHQVHDEVLTVLAGMTDDDLYKPYSDYQPTDPPRNEDPVIYWIVGNTFEHDEEHLGWIRQLTEANAAASS